MAVGQRCICATARFFHRLKHLGSVHLCITTALFHKTLRNLLAKGDIGFGLLSQTFFCCFVAFTTVNARFDFFAEVMITMLVREQLSFHFSDCFLPFKRSNFSLVMTFLGQTEMLLFGFTCAPLGERAEVP